MQKVVAIQLLASVVLFDIIVALFMKERAKKAYPLYLNLTRQSLVEHGRGYPRFHFANHPTRGFDISRSTGKILASSKPSEGDPYYVWGNSIGCFDTEPNNTKRYEVYLAGDSFTWGYTSFDKKFGTILEKKLGSPVAKCGVTHTGQLHQFHKFKEVAKSIGYYPKTIIVNIVSNDVDNDYFYPHSMVIDGYQVENVRWKRLANGEIEVQRFTVEDLQKLYEKFKRDKERASKNKLVFNLRRYDPRRLSATFIVLGELAKAIKHTKENEQVYLKDDFVRSPYGLKNAVMATKDTTGTSRTYPDRQSISRKNLEAINQWILHSKANGYRLIFSLIPDKEGYDYSGLKKHIISSGGEVYDFSEYIQGSAYSMTPKKLYWQHDEHFNESGNSLYAKYLYEVLSRS